MPKANIDAIEAQNIRIATAREEKEKRAKLRAIEIAAEEAREARIKQLQGRAKRDAQNDAMPARESQETDELEATTREEPYLPPSDPSFLIGKSKKSTRPKFIPDFDPDEVPPLE